MYRCNNISNRCEKTCHYVQRMSVDESREVNQLVALFRGMGFTRSAQISHYIREHRLGLQFPNISGFLKLTRDKHGIADTWEFEGGIKPRFYRAICEMLEIGNNGSDAQVSGFESYRQRGVY